MALRNQARADLVTGLHTGPHRLGVAGLCDPQANDWIVMNDPAVATGGVVNALVVAPGGTGTALRLSAGGTNPDTNAGVTIVGNGTGTVTLGSSVSPVSLAGALTGSSNLAVVGQLAVRSATVSSAAVLSIQFGSSGPAIYFGSSAPTIAATAGSLFLNTGGSSLTTFSVAIQNGGSASSSNWANYTPI